MGGSDSSKDPDPSNSNSFGSGSGSGAGSSKNRIRNTSTTDLAGRSLPDMIWKKRRTVKKNRIRQGFQLIHIGAQSVNIWPSEMILTIS